jgi:hypothetical protein
MHRMTFAAAALAALLASGGAVRADTIWDVENARGNARAGGPVSAYDAELLERWGCLSGTRNAFCQQIRHGANSGAYRAYRRRWRR